MRPGVPFRVFSLGGRACGFGGLLVGIIVLGVAEGDGGYVRMWQPPVQKKVSFPVRIFADKNHMTVFGGLTISLYFFGVCYHTIKNRNVQGKKTTTRKRLCD